MTTDDPPIQQVGEDAVRVRTGDVTAVVSGTCPHRGGRLRYAFVDSVRRQIRCPLHSSTFDLRTGHRVAGPSCGALTVWSWETANSPQPGEPE
jgi:nitrite reductase/ring-hydroxylating ferredoxin subunit